MSPVKRHNRAVKHLASGCYLARFLATISYVYDEGCLIGVVAVVMVVAAATIAAAYGSGPVVVVVVVVVLVVEVVVHHHGGGTGGGSGVLKQLNFNKQAEEKRVLLLGCCSGKKFSLYLQTLSLSGLLGATHAIDSCISLYGLGFFFLIFSFRPLCNPVLEGSRNSSVTTGPKPLAKGSQQPDLFSFDRNLMNGVRQKNDLMSFDKDKDRNLKDEPIMHHGKKYADEIETF